MNVFTKLIYNKEATHLITKEIKIITTLFEITVEIFALKSLIILV